MERWIAYPVIEVPPFAGAVQETVTLRSEAETEGAAGVDGLQNVEFEDGVDWAPFPATFTALMIIV